ncbi:hypothetical protein HDV00_011701, partial [Rhizophlyctis rosea]
MTTPTSSPPPFHSTPEDRGFSAVDLSDKPRSPPLSDSKSAIRMTSMNGNGLARDSHSPSARIPLAERGKGGGEEGEYDEDEGSYVDDFDDDGLLDDIERGRRVGGRKREFGGGEYKDRLLTILRRPWVLMCGLAGVLVIIVLMSVAASNPPVEDEGHPTGSSLPNVTLGHILNYTFWPQSAHYNWVKAGPDGSYLSYQQGSYVLKHIEFENVTVLAEQADLVDANGNLLSPREVMVSYDGKYLLLETDYEKGWRHSFFANYWIFDVEKKTASPLTTSKPDKEIPEEIGNGKVALAVWSPKNHHVAWVRQNDLFVKMNAEIEVRITTDGSKDLINGITDWVYEGMCVVFGLPLSPETSSASLRRFPPLECAEEVYGAHEALWFSPDGSRLAYLKFNETLVPEYRLQLYMHEKENQYPTDVGIKYPKAGAPNPTVTLHIATPSSPNANTRSIPVSFNSTLYFPDEDRLITEVVWISDNDKLLVRVMNRVQDVQRVFVVEYMAGANGTESRWEGRVVRDEANQDGGWFNKLQPITPIPPSPAIGRQNPSYIELMEDESGWTHLAYFADVGDKSPKTWLTRGEWEVTK